jgi:hypothetical protein
MPKKATREERLKSIETKMSRHQFARFTALGGVAAMMTTKASATLPLDKLTKTNEATFVGRHRL